MVGGGCPSCFEGRGIKVKVTVRSDVEKFWDPISQELQLIVLK